MLQKRGDQIWNQNASDGEDPILEIWGVVIDPVALWPAYSPMVRKTRVQSQVELIHFYSYRQLAS